MHKSHSSSCVCNSNPLRKDPTRTTTLQRQFATDLRKRLNAIKRDLIASLENYFRQYTNAYNFPTDTDKLKSFQRYLQSLYRQHLPGEEYWEKYVNEGFFKGIKRAKYDFAKRTPVQFIFTRPESIAKVKLLTSRVYSNLNGITEEMSTQLTRVLADGFVQEKSIDEIAKAIAKTVDGIEIKRARVLARTEIIRAHAEGQLDAIEQLGFKELGIMVEWSTGSSPCGICASWAGEVLSIEEAHGLIPIHPNCRCCFIPILKEHR